MNALRRPQPKVPSQDKSLVDDPSISFVYDKRLAKGTRIEKVGQTALNDPDDKPDGVEPANLLVSFLDWRGVSKGRIAEIKVLPIEGYKDAFKLSAVDYRYTTAQIEAVRNLIATSVRPERLPFVPYTDNFQAIYSHPSLINFKDGKGILYVTQFTGSMAELISNDKLTAVFQGLSNDGHLYVVGTFPITSERVALNQDSECDLGFCTSEIASNPQNGLKAYQNYLRSVEMELAEDNAFEPDLGLLRELCESLRIRSL